MDKGKRALKRAAYVLWFVLAAFGAYSMVNPWVSAVFFAAALLVAIFASRRWGY